MPIFDNELIDNRSPRGGAPLIPYLESPDLQEIDLSINPVAPIETQSNTLSRKGYSIDEISSLASAPSSTPTFNSPIESVKDEELIANKRYPVYQRGVDLENIYGLQQSGWKQIGNGIVKMVATGLGTFAQAQLTIPDTIKAIKSGKLSDLAGDPEGFEGSVDTWLKNIEDKFPNYYTRYEQQHPFKGAIPFARGSANFWGDKVIKNLGFTIGAIGGAVAQDAVIGVMTEGIGEIPLIGAQIGKAALWLNKLFTGTKDVEKFLEGARVAGATGEQLLNMKRLAELASFTKVTNGARYGLNLFGASRTEAGIEARDGYRIVKDELIKQYKLEHINQEPTGEDMAEIEDYASSAMNTRFGINMALLTVSNAIQFDNLFRIFGNASKRGIGSSITKNIEEAGKIGLKEGSLNEFEIKAPATFIGKAWEAIKPKLPMLFSEGVYEEGGQYAAERGTYNYSTRKYKNFSNKDYADNWNTLNETIKSTVQGLKEEFGTSEGLENIFLGALTALITGGGTNIIDRVKGQGKDARLQYAVNTVNQYGVTGILQKKYEDTLSAAGIAKDMQEAVKTNDVFKYKNLQQDMFFKFVNSRIPAGMHDVTIEQLNMLKDISKEDFEATFGMDFNESNKSTVAEYVDKLIDSANQIKETVDVLDRTYKNPFKFTLSPKTDDEIVESKNHQTFNDWKTDIAYYSSVIPNLNSRIISMGQDIMNIHPGITNDLAASLTNNKSLRELANEYTKEADRLNATITESSTSEDRKNIKSQIKTLRTNSERINLALDGKEDVHTTFTTVLNFELNGRNNKELSKVSSDKALDVFKYGVDINRANDLKEKVGKIIDELNSRKGFEKYFEQAKTLEETAPEEAETVEPIIPIVPKFKNSTRADEVIQLDRIYEGNKINGAIIKQITKDSYQVITPDGNIYLGKTYTRERALEIVEELNQDINPLLKVKVRAINSDGTISVEDLSGNIQRILPSQLNNYKRVKTKEEEIAEEAKKLGDEQSKIEGTSSTIPSVPPSEGEHGEEPKLRDWYSLFAGGTTESEDYFDPSQSAAHVKRSRMFLNNAKNFKDKNKNPIRGRLRTILVTAKDEEKAGMTGLSDLVFEKTSPPKDGDTYEGLIAQVFVEQDTKGHLHFIDEEGNRLRELGKQVDLNKVVFQVMPTPRLTNSKGEPRYRENEKEQAIAASKAWEQMRKDLFNNNPLKPYKFSISRGIPIINDKINGVYERNHVGNVLIPEEKIATQQGIVEVVTAGAVVHQGQSIKFRNGLTIFNYGDTLAILDNTKFTKEKATNIYNVIKEMAAEIAENKTINPLYSGYLENVLFWRKGDSKSGNQIFVDVATGQIVLGGERYNISEIEQNKEKIIEQLQGVFHNINNKTLEKQFDKEFKELVYEGNERKEITWRNYQTYLLASKHPDGSARNISETPLFTPIAKPTENRWLVPYSFKQKYATLEAFELPIAPTITQEEKVSPTAPIVPQIKGYAMDGSQQTYPLSENRPVLFSGKIIDGQLEVSVYPNSTTKTISENGVTMTDTILPILIQIHGKEFVKDIKEEEGKVIQFLADKIYKELSEAQEASPKKEISDTEKRRSTTFNNFYLEKEGNQVYEYYIKPDGTTEEVYGKDEKEVRDKISAKYDAEKKLTKVEPIVVAPKDMEAKRADIERRRENELISTVTKEISYNELEKNIDKNIDGRFPYHNIIVNKITYEYDRKLKKFFPIQVASSSNLNLEAIAYRESTAKDISDFKNKEILLDVANYFSTTVRGGKDAIKELVNYKKRLTSEGNFGKTYGQTVVDINSKYDAELAALGETKKPRGRAKRIVGINEENKERLSPADIETYKQWAKEAIPQFSTEVLDRLIEINPTEKAWGVYENNIIKFYNKALKIVPYHEAFEAIWNTFLSPEEQEGILAEERPKYLELKDPQIKENIADQFGEFKLGKLPAKSLSQKIIKFFKDIIEFFKTFGRKPSLKTQLFEAINSGKFREYTIPEAAKFNAPVYRRVEGMTETQAAGFVEDMTIMVSQFIFGNGDKSLLYNPLKLTDEYVFENIKQTYIDEGKYGEDGLIKTDRAWKMLVKRTKEALLPIGRFNEEEEEENINNGERTKNEYTKGDFVIDLKKSSTFDVKITLSTLSEKKPTNQQDALSIEVPEDVTSSVDGYKSLNFSQVFATLLSRFSNTTNIDKIEEKFAELAKYDANYVTAFQRFGAKSVTKANNDIEIQPYFDFANFDKDDWRLFISFYQTFTRQHPDSVVQYIDGNTVYSGTSDVFSAIEEMQKDWFENIKVMADDPKSPITFNKKEKVYEINKDAIPKAIPKKPQEAIDFLTSLGINFTKEAFLKLKTEEEVGEQDSQQTKFLKAVNSIYTYLGEAKEIATINGKTLGINKPLHVLSELLIRVTNPIQENTHLNPNGKRVQNYVDNNVPSIFENEFNGTNTFEELKEERPELNDVFSKNSVVFKKGGLFYDREGKRTKKRIKVGNIEGIDDINNDEGDVITDLSRGDRYITEINQNLNGDYYILVPGEGNTEWKMNLGNYITYDDVVSGDWNRIYNVFRGYLDDDIALAMDWENREKLLNVGDKARDLRIFQDILHKDILEGLNRKIAEGDSIEDIEKYIADNIEDINASVREFITNSIEQTKNDLINNGKMTPISSEEGTEKFAIPMLDNTFTGEKIDKFDLSEKQLTDILSFTNVNYIINNIEFHKILFGDPYQFAVKDGQLEETKRIKSFLSPRRLTFDTPLYNTWLNQTYNVVDGITLDEDELGNHQYKSYAPTITTADILTESDNYAKINEADASSLLMDGTYKEIKLKNRQWSQEAENWHQWQMAFTRQNIPGYTYKNEKLKEHDIKLLKTREPVHVIEVLKPIVSGVKNNSNDINLILDKFSQMPLYYKATLKNGKETNLSKHYTKMWKEKIGYVIMKSGRKVGVTTQYSLYNPDGTFNTAPFGETIDVPWKAYGIQLENSYEGAKGQTMGSQPTKISSLDLYRNGEPISADAEKAYKRNVKALYNLHENGYKQLLVKLGIEDLGTGFRLVDPKTVQDTLEHEMLRRELSNNVKDTIQLDDNGEFIIPFESSSAYDKIKDILYSIVNKSLISQKLTGGPKVEAPVTLWENAKEGRGIVKKNEEGKWEKITKEQFSILSDEEKKNVKLSSDTLKFYENQDDKRYCEVMIRCPFDKKKLDKKKFPDDKAILDYLNKTEEGQSILSGIGFRIPTQGMSSIEVFRIKEFLPDFMGDTIIVPTEITAKAGSDFDIDKLNTYLKSIYIDENGDIKLVRYLENEETTKEFFRNVYASTINAKIDKITENNQFREDLLNIFSKLESLPEEGEEIAREEYTLSDEENEFYDKYNDLISEIISQADEQEILPSVYMQEQLDKAHTERGELSLKLFNDVLKEQYVNNMYQRAIENEYYDSLREMLTLPENFERLLAPLTDAGLKKIAKTLDELRGIDETKIKNRLLDRSYMTNLRHAYVSTKKNVGIAAVNITGHSLTQKAKIIIDPARFPLVSKYDQKFLGDGVISLPHNEIDGYATLSGDKTADNKQYISERLSGYATGFVDAINNPYIIKIISHDNAVSTLLFLERLGAGDTAIFFMNQPIIQEYLNHLDNIGVSGLFSKGNIKYIMDKFNATPIEIYTDILETNEENIPTKYETKIKEIKVDTFSLDKLDKNIEKYYSNEKFSEIEKAEQVLILGEFLKYAKMAQYAFKLTQATNYDTTKIRSGAGFSRKQTKTRVAIETNIFSGIEEMLKNTFLGEHITFLDGAMSAMGEILTLEREAFTEGILKGIIAPYEENEYLSADKFDRIANKLRASFLDYIIQTKSKVSDRIEELLIDTKTSVAAQLAQARISHPEMLILKKLRVITSDRRGESQNNTKTLKLDVKSSLASDENMYTDMLRELKEVEPVLYDGIVKLSILQGSYPSAFSIKNIIPVEDFSQEIKEIINTVSDTQDVRDFAKGWFQRNNWRDKNIVPRLTLKVFEQENAPPQVDRFGVDISTYSIPVFSSNVFWGNEMKIGERLLPNSRKILLLNEKYDAKFLNYDVVTVPRVITYEGTEEMIDIVTGITLTKSMYKQRMLKGDTSVKDVFGYQKVKYSNGQPVTTINYKGDIQHVYKLINLYGDGQYASEYYNDFRPSVLNNGTVKVANSINPKLSGEIPDSDIIKQFGNKVEEKETIKTPNVVSSQPAIKSIKEVNWDYLKFGDNPLYMGSLMEAVQNLITKNNIDVKIIQTPGFKDIAAMGVSNDRTSYIIEYDPNHKNVKSNIQHELIHVAIETLADEEFGRLTNELSTLYSLYISSIDKDLMERFNKIRWKGNVAEESRKQFTEKEQAIVHASENIHEFIAAYIGNKDVQSVFEDKTNEQMISLIDRFKQWIEKMINKILSNYEESYGKQLSNETKREILHLVKDNIDNYISPKQLDQITGAGEYFGNKEEKIVPIQISNINVAPKGINISSYESGLGGLLTNFAKLSVNFNGKLYPSSEVAYQSNKKDLSDEGVLNLMIAVISAKLEQHPNLIEEITNKGGIDFLNESTHNLIKNGNIIKKDRWTGKDGLFMKALRQAYSLQLSKTNVAPTGVNTIVDKSLSWGEIKDLPIYSDKGINVMRKQGTVEHFGNPFTANPELAKGNSPLILVKDIPTAVQAYKDWLKDNYILTEDRNGVAQEYMDINIEQRNWINSQIEEGKLNGKTLLYMNDKGEYYSHADALRDIVNNRQNQQNLASTEIDDVIRQKEEESKKCNQ